jgi:hypothetical protein
MGLSGGVPSSDVTSVLRSPKFKVQSFKVQRSKLMQGAHGSPGYAEGGFCFLLLLQVGEGSKNFAPGRSWRVKSCQWSVISDQKKLEPISKPVSKATDTFLTRAWLETGVLSPPLKKGNLGGFQMVR